jgi:hypothetical protein
MSPFPLIMEASHSPNVTISMIMEASYIDEKTKVKYRIILFRRTFSRICCYFCFVCNSFRYQWLFKIFRKQIFILHQHFQCSLFVVLETHCLVWFMVFNATFNNISIISWQADLLVEETGVHRRKPLTCRKSLTNFIT